VSGLKRKSREWAGQYQQRPAPASGIIFQPNWWRYYKSRDPLPKFDQVAISVDCAFKSAAENDYVSIQKWGAVGPRSYLLECRTEHLGYTATKVAIKAMKARGLRANVILIEDKANGSAVIEELRREDLGAALIAVNPEAEKRAGPSRRVLMWRLAMCTCLRMRPGYLNFFTYTPISPPLNMTTA
jgi:hypothetical protein